MESNGQLPPPDFQTPPPAGAAASLRALAAQKGFPDIQIAGEYTGQGEAAWDVWIEAKRNDPGRFELAKVKLAVLVDKDAPV